MQFLNIWNVFFVLVLLKKCACGDSQTNSKNEDNASGTGLKTEMSKVKDVDDLSVKLDATKLEDTCEGHSFGQNRRKHFQSIKKEGQGNEIKKQDAENNKENPQEGSKQLKIYANCTRDDETINKNSVDDSKDNEDSEDSGDSGGSEGFGCAGNELHEIYIVLCTKLYSFQKYVLKMDILSDLFEKKHFGIINFQLIDRNEQRDFHTVYEELTKVIIRLQNLAKKQNNEYYLGLATVNSNFLANVYSLFAPPDTSENLEVE